MSATPAHMPVRPGDRIPIELPYSEVCMFLGLAGKVREVELHKHYRPTAFEPDRATYTARVLNSDGTYASMLPAEAGIIFDAGQFVIR